VKDTLVLKEPEQLKALGHPLRVRVLEMLGQEGESGEWQLTNRELAQRLGVDPGHLHFHVRMLLKAGLIELADSNGRGREKPYRAVARVFRV
jgi:DNA-binding transcriptional ArsR family regulator